MRHAKSDWAEAQQRDFDRPLNSRGRKGADAMALWIAEQAGIPDLILCSEAARTRETLARMLKQWKFEIDTRYFESLYHADPETILKTVRSDGGDASRVLVIGHNPGMEMLAAKLADRYQPFVTATVAVFDIPESLRWESLRMNQVLPLVAFGSPKEMN